MRKKLQNPQAILAAQRDSAALEALLPEAEKLVWAVFWRYVGPRRLMATGFEPEDLHQQGMIGFLNAVRRYDPGRGVQFTSYAVPHIVGEMRKALRDHGSLLKLSRGLINDRWRMMDAYERLADALGREPSTEELVQESGLSAQTVGALLTAQTMAYLDAPYTQTKDGDTASLMDVIGDDDGWEDVIEAQADFDLFLSRLNDRDRQIVLLRAKGLSQQQIAEQLGTSQAHVSRRLALIRERRAARAS